MDDKLRIQLLAKLVSDDDILSLNPIRKNKYEIKSLQNHYKDQIAQALAEGWEIDREFKTTVRLRKSKYRDVYFEDRVWSLFASLGFHTMNRDRQFRLPCDKKNPNLTQQIDVFAKDDESILIIECKSALKPCKGDFKKELDAIKGNYKEIVDSIKGLYPGTKPKIKYILATENYTLSEPDKQRLDSFGGIHFDSETIDYYEKMYNQIKLAARYQLLGSIFAGQEIPELDNRIPAIQGKMGNHIYYAFSIEPEKLLKMSYVLHRNKANSNMMPTYQRIIKKKRLQAIHKFIDEEKGYFPNSIVVSIDGGKKNKLEFQPANTQVNSAIATCGILCLPKRYRSVYIIDGQHRLYGYAESRYKNSNSIPVVAFLNLERSEQVKLFMQINENQKAVSKDLRNTLSADLLWTSEDKIEQLKALKSRIALRLGEDKISPLYGYISIGEDKRVITTQQIGIALSKSAFLGKVSKNTIEELGTFYKGDLEEAYNSLSDFLILCFDYIKDNLIKIWEEKDNIIVINKGVFALIMIFSDLISHALKENLITEKVNSKIYFKGIQTYLDDVINFYKDLDEETVKALKSSYGTGGDTKYWRAIQQYIKKSKSDFNPEGLDEYLKREKKEFNTKAYELLIEIMTFIKDDFKDKLENEYGNAWLKKGVSPKLGEEVSRQMFLKNRDIEDEKNEVTAWDCFSINNYIEIAHKNWRLFEHDYTRPGEEKKSGGKAAKTNWLADVNRIKSKIDSSQYVSEEDYYFMDEIRNWLYKYSNKD